jgi:hypothetical protein
VRRGKGAQRGVNERCNAAGASIVYKNQTTTSN